MAIDEREIYFAHTLDVAWIIALWHWIHGGDPARDGLAAQTTELMARALVGHLSDRKTEAPKDIVEKLGIGSFQSHLVQGPPTSSGWAWVGALNFGLPGCSVLRPAGRTVSKRAD